MSEVRARVIVTGRVQGVCFRSWTEQRMSSLGLKGWVKNLPNGSVEAVVEGASDKVQLAVKALQSGPSQAKVDEVQLDYETPTGEFSGFSIR
jgi:acylphosphatase